MRTVLSLLVPALLLISGCSGTTVILLPDEDGHVGEAVVEADGKQTLIRSASETAKTEGHDVSLSVTSRERIDREFGTELKMHPLPAKSIIVHFASAAVEPIENDSSYIPDAIKAYSERKNPFVSVIGHSDKAGDKKLNDTISRRRAETVANKLLKAGIPSRTMEVQNFGYGIPLVPYRPGVRSEPKNRRVEIFIR